MSPASTNRVAARRLAIVAAMVVGLGALPVTAQPAAPSSPAQETPAAAPEAPPSGPGKAARVGIGIVIGVVIGVAIIAVALSSGGSSSPRGYGP